MDASIKTIQSCASLLLRLCFVALVVSCTNATPTLSPLNIGPSNQAELSSLTLSSGTLNPGFASGTTDYTSMFIGTSSVVVTPTAAESHATITVNGTAVVSGQASPAITLPFGNSTITIIVRAQDGKTTKTYNLSAHQLTRESYIKASNTGADDQFGYSIALSGDTLVVGAPKESSAVVGTGDGDQLDNSLPQSGAVYVFARTNGVWRQQAYLKASNTGAGDLFGWSVVLSGDTLAVGAIGESSAATGINGNQADNGAFYSGAVYVFTRVNSEWSQQAYLKASNTGASDFFGYSVALSGETLAIGAIKESSNATGVNGNQSDNTALESGAVYVFTRAGGVWSQQAYVKASNPGLSDQFGYSVALSGDMLAVGAIHERSAAMGINGDQTDNSASASGAVYVFTRTGAIWAQEAYLKASNTNVGDQFGYSVGLSGDTLAVGASEEDSAAVGVNGNQADNGAPASGAVYVFTKAGGVWSQQAYLKASNTEAGDQFGSRVALDGDMLAVSAAFEDGLGYGVNPGSAAEGSNSASSSGAVYVFMRSNGLWSQQAYVKASNTTANYQFGSSVALSGDTLAVGSTGESASHTGVIDFNPDDLSAPNSGAVYVWR
ncbi:MAG: cadherin-like beta sandwich domain-containing protein [Nitrospira sp.]|nr:cadherin-like beta sandwich domain-containing protein [Nitrospira sp.]